MAELLSSRPRVGKAAGLTAMMAGLFGAGPLARPRATPYREMGVSGTAVFSGYVVSKERDPRVLGDQKWITYADIATNTSIVAAGVRYFLNLIANADWSVDPVDDTPAAKEAAEFLEDVVHDMTTSWARVTRRAATYRFHGFGVHEWTAKRRKQDGRIGFEDIEVRPQHTIERWDVDERGTVRGMWQRSPQTGSELYLPRGKVAYLVDDALTDSPEGTGLFRHLVDPATRLQRYLDLEGKGFERDLRGIPVGRAPYAAIAAAVKANQITKDDAAKITAAIESFVQLQAKDTTTSIVLDSAAYTEKTADGQAVSTVPMWGVDLLTGDSSGFADIGKGIDRLNREMARVLNMEQLMLGDGSGGNRALSEDKSRALYLTVNSTLGDIAEALDRDVVGPVWALNGMPDELRPHLKASDISFRAVSEITAALRDMATAGAVMAPDDPAIDDVRDMLGISRQPEIDPDMMRALMGVTPGFDADNEDDPDGNDPDGDDDEEDLGDNDDVDEEEEEADETPPARKPQPRRRQAAKSRRAPARKARGKAKAKPKPRSRKAAAKARKRR